MKIRKLDYIIVFLIFIVLYGIQLMAPITVGTIVALFIGALIYSAIIGTITNMIGIIFNFIIEKKRK